MNQKSKEVYGMDLEKDRPREWTGVSNFDATEIIYEKKYFDSGGVARISINRPEKMNALTGVGFGEICDALSEASHDHTVGRRHSVLAAMSSGRAWEGSAVSGSTPSPSTVPYGCAGSRSSPR
jgi:hypothetical protein